MSYPNFSDQAFTESMNKPEGMHPSMTGELPDAYLKRADVLLALKRFHLAAADFRRAQLFKSQANDWYRWRSVPGLNAVQIDLQTLETQPNIKAWIRLFNEKEQDVEGPPVEYRVSCTRRDVQINGGAAFGPAPGTMAESIRDYFCAASPN
jgi:hypothetical protein